MSNAGHRWRATEDAQEQARRLRQRMTAAERLLWQRLRSNRLCGYHFRRQHAIGSYIVDFCCARCRLVVELDGGVHVLKAERDEARTMWLEERGYRVIRFTNEEVRERLGEVLGVIRGACDEGTACGDGDE